MIRNRIIQWILLLLFVLFAGNFAASQNSTISGTDEIMSQIAQVKDLLDSWHGERKVLDEAKEKLDKILAADPKNYHALKELSRYHIKHGYMYNVNRRNGRTIYSAGQYQPGTLERAEKTIKSALQINPDYAEGYVLLGYIYTQQARFKEANDALTRAESIGADDPWLHLNWAELFIALGDKEKATARYQIILQNGTKDKQALLSAYSYLLDDCKNQKKYEQAEDLYKSICKLDPTNAWAKGNYADFLRSELGRIDEAIIQAREALSISNYGVGRRILALCLYAKWADLIINQKQPENQAQQYYNEAFRLFPDLNFVMAYEGSRTNGKSLATMLVSKGISVDARVEDGFNALIIASNTGQIDSVRHLLSLGANLNSETKKGWTPLLCAAVSGHQEIVKILLDRGADTSQRVENMDAATLAERRGRIDIANLIRQHTKASPNKRRDN
ncbi:ankyrin repeat domain-containing protein [Candidatus Sumerlaeota bacterium]|nr:ankyrin repeat domain-containing protein [Candidatus Sumerlaeota bacterium]